MKRGRPPRILSTTINDVDQLLQSEPEISAAQVALRLGLRKQTSQTIVRGLRATNSRFPKTRKAA